MLLESSPESSTYVNIAYPVSFSTTSYYGAAKFGTGANSKLVRDPTKNALFFDPFKEYKPWIKADGTTYTNASHTSLYKTPNKIHPDDKKIVQSPSTCKTTNLTASYKPCYKYTYCDSATKCYNNRSNSYWPGNFYYNGKNYDLKNTSTNYSTGWFYSGSPSITTQNMLTKAANWYTYYRDRKNVAKAALGYALQDIPENVLIGFTTFSYAKDHQNSPLIFDYKKFTSNDKGQLYEAFYNEDNAGGTPLREALLNVNNYIKNTDSLWYENQQPLSCRRAYNIVISDGNWSDGTINFNINSDGTDGANITGRKGQAFKYNPNLASAYKDPYAGTLADIAMEFWKNDIRPDLENTLYVSPDHKNPAFWQHIVTHSISLNDEVDTEIPSVWPNVLLGSNSIQRYMDMWHASLNSKGGYLHSTDFESLKGAISTFLNDAANLTSTVGFINSGIGKNNYVLDNNSMLFKTFFNPITWSGELKGFKLDTDGNIVVDASNVPWEASKQLPVPNNRNILALLKNGTNSSIKALRWTQLSPTEQTTLGSQSILNYLRGDRLNEGFQYTTGTPGFRLRSNPLGDFINSKPVYVATPPFDYSFDGYENYKATQANRLPMVYAASNDGFLHGFNANTGEEKFAITNQLSFNNLKYRSDYAYIHEYGIDGTSKPGDVYINNTWNTLLITPMATGGQALFSINITNPNGITESNANSLTGAGFWQFDDSNDSDLGFTFADPVITRINSSATTSTWGVIIGNGYNNTLDDGRASTTGNAVLYVLNPSNGSIIKKIDTGLGKSGDPEGKNRPNGLSSPTVIDYNNDSKADYVYAGDVFGNVWKFDLTNANPSQWSATKLFTNDSATTQSITVAPDIKKSPTDNGVIIYVATGRFIGKNDITNTQKNSIYAIYDNFNKTNIKRSDLIQQTIVSNVMSNNRNNRILSNNAVDYSKDFGWYIDLPNNELVLNRPKLSQGYLLVSSYIPDPNNFVCTNDQKGYLYTINPLTGGAVEYATMDINNDKIIDNNDLVNNNKVGGIELKTEHNSEPIIMQLDNNRNVIMMNTQDGDVLPVVTKRNATPPTRRSWKNIKSVDVE